MAATQLTLIDRKDWQLDRDDREVGRRGVQEAREALRRASGPKAPRPSSPPAAA
jgi:hypothetical protein